MEEEISRQQAIEVLKALKNAGDYKSLLEGYYYHPSLRGDIRDIFAGNSDVVFDFIRTIWNSYPLEVRKGAIELLKDMGNNKNSLRLLVEGLMTETSVLIQPKIKAALVDGAERLKEIDDYLLELSGTIGGKKFEILADIISLIFDRDFLRSTFMEIKNKCPLGYKICAHDIVLENSFFVGHRFSEKKKDDMRPHIDNAILSFDKHCVPYYADSDMAGDFFCKICKKIQTTRFGIYDISIEHNDKCCSPNPNVMLELGLSLAFGKKTIVIMEDGQKPPSDLTRTDIVFYHSYKDLEDKLKEKIPKVLVIA